MEGFPQNHQRFTTDNQQSSTCGLFSPMALKLVIAIVAPKWLIIVDLTTIGYLFRLV